MLTTTTMDRKFNTEFDNLDYNNKYYFHPPIYDKSKNDKSKNDKKLSVLEIVIEVEKEINIVIDIIGKMKKINIRRDKAA